MRIAIAGKFLAGKSTAADALVERLGFEKHSLAGPLKVTAARIADWFHDRHLISPSSYADLMDKTTPLGRSYLQHLGTEISRGSILPDLWEVVLLHRLGGRDDIVVDDLRLRTEAEHLLAADFLLVRIDTPEEVRQARVAQTYLGLPVDQSHRSETELDGFEGFHKVFDGSLPIERFRDEVVAWAGAMTWPRERRREVRADEGLQKWA